MITYDRIKALMSERKITWKQISEQLKVGKNQLKYWEEKNTLPDGKTLIKLSDYFGVSTDYLLGKTDIKEKNADSGEFSKGINVRFIGHDGTIKSKRLSPELIVYLESIPDINSSDSSASGATISSDIADTVTKGENVFGKIRTDAN